MILKFKRFSHLLDRSFELDSPIRLGYLLVIESTQYITKLELDSIKNVEVRIRFKFN